MADQSRVEAFVHQAFGDIGGALTAALVVVGDETPFNLVFEACP